MRPLEKLESSLVPPRGRRVPGSPAELDAEWLTVCLQHAGAIPPTERVLSYTSERIGEGHGFAGRLERLALRYEPDGGTGPRTLVAKFAAEHAATRELMGTFDAYAREVRFYRELAPNIGVPTPRCYFAHYDQEAARFLLLLEDLAPACMADVETGLSVEQAKLVLEQLAAMHARYWDRVEDVRWLELTEELLSSVRARFLASLPGFLVRFGPSHPQLARVAHGMAEFFAGDEFQREVRRPPLTIAHNDLHLNNVFLPGAQGGRLAIIDWQSVALSRHGITDVARILSLGLDPAVRRAHLGELLRHYHARLLALGVRGYSYRLLQYRLRQEMVASVIVGVMVMDTLDLSSADGQRVGGLFLARIDAAVTDARVGLILDVLLAWVRVKRLFARWFGRAPKLDAGSR